MEFLPDKILLKIFGFATGKGTSSLGVKTLYSLRHTCTKFHNFIEIYRHALRVPKVALRKNEVIFEKSSMFNSFHPGFGHDGQKSKINEPLLIRLEKHGISRIGFDRDEVDIEDTTYSVPSLLSQKRNGRSGVRKKIMA